MPEISASGDASVLLNETLRLSFIREINLFHKNKSTMQKTIT